MNEFRFVTHYYINREKIDFVIGQLSHILKIFYNFVKNLSKLPLRKEFLKMGFTLLDFSFIAASL